MSLRFEHQEPSNAVGRGMATESKETFHMVYAGDLEFANYFLVQTTFRTFWRWTTLLTGSLRDSCGEEPTEQAVRDVLEEKYIRLLTMLTPAAKS